MSQDSDSPEGTVLHLIDTDGPGGAETIYVALAEGLENRGWRSVVVLTANGWTARQLERRGLEPTIVGLTEGWDARHLGRLWRLIDRENVDLVQAHLLGSALYGAAAARLRRIPAVGTFHGSWDLRNAGSFPGFKMRVLSACLDTAVFVSAPLRREFARNAPSLSVPEIEIPNGIDITRFRPPNGSGRESGFRSELGLGGDHFLVGTVGNLRPAKDHGAFLHLAARLRAGDDSYRFVIVGDATGEALRDLNALKYELGLEDRLFLTGYRDDVERIMSSLDVFVLTSSSEGFSLTTVEAMASGLPVIATRCGGPEEIIDHGRNGFLADVGDTRGLAQRVEDVRSSPGLRRELGRTARQHVVRHYSREHMIDAYQNLYRALLRGESVDSGR